MLLVRRKKLNYDGAEIAIAELTAKQVIEIQGEKGSAPMIDFILASMNNALAPGEAQWTRDRWDLEISESIREALIVDVPEYCKIKAKASEQGEAPVAA